MNDCAYGELSHDQYGIPWVKVQPNSLHDLTLPRNVLWSLPVLETLAANDAQV